MAGKIKILIVDDSMFFRAALKKGLSSQSDFEVVAEAYDPYEARDKILEHEPDVMTLDIEMPYMSGVEFLKVLLPQWPIPVIVVSSAKAYAAEAMRAGALDFLRKPESRSPETFDNFSADLARRIRMLAESGRTKKYRAAAPPPPPSSAGCKFKGIIAIGASTGGTQSTAKILKALPADMPGMVIVQHMPPDFTRMYAENLDKDCALSISEAKDGDIIKQGKVFIAPGNQHMTVAKSGTNYIVKCFAGEKVNGHCPSVDVLFDSVSKVMGRDAIGVILTGMGADGASGLLAMRRAGARTIGQDEKSCVVYGMPKEAYLRGAVVKQVSKERMAGALVDFLKGGR